MMETAKPAGSEAPFLGLGDDEVAEGGDAFRVLQFFRIDEVGVEGRRLSWPRLTWTRPESLLMM